MDDVLNELLNSVPINTSKRFDCPSCGGRNTLSVINSYGTIKYLCFKASCGIRGNGISHITAEEVYNRLLNTNFSNTNVSFAIPEHIILGIANKNCLNMLEQWHCMSAYRNDMFSCGYDPKENRLVFFVKDANNNIVGAIGRKLDKYGTKVKNYLDSQPLPFICGNTDILVLVEDCFSAIAVTRTGKYTGMALLGTNLKEEYIPYILKYQQVIVALDADAKNKALSIKNHLTYYHNDVRVRFIEKDIKLMTNDEFSIW